MAAVTSGESGTIVYGRKASDPRAFESLAADKRPHDGIRLAFIVLFSYSACKSGSVADDESAVSIAATAVSRIHAEAEPTLVRITSLEALGH
jgi:hypothetical protein